MNLVNQRNEWRKGFCQGERLDSKLLEDYRKNRDSECFRLSSHHEKMLEYILYLEQKVKENG